MTWEALEATREDPARSLDVYPEFVHGSEDGPGLFTEGVLDIGQSSVTAWRIPAGSSVVAASTTTRTLSMSVPTTDPAAGDEGESDLR